MSRSNTMSRTITTLRKASRIESLKEAMKILVRDKQGLAGLIIVSAYVIVAILAVIGAFPPIGGQNPAAAYAPPSLKDFPWLLFGKDFLGRPLLLVTLYGTPYILEVAVLAAIISLVIGLVLGLIAGYVGGVVDTFLNFIFNVVLSIPSIPLYLILALAFHSSNPIVVAGILTVIGWAGLARSIRAFVLSLKERNFVMMARIFGFSPLKLMFSEILPMMAPYIFMNFLFGMLGGIYGLVGLYFLGILPLNANNWGVQLNLALSIGGAVFTPRGNWAVILPITAIIVLQTGLIFLASASDTIFNPALRGGK